MACTSSCLTAPSKNCTDPSASRPDNVAEYNGLLAALRWAVEHGHKVLKIRADSELLVKQMRGE